jgi:hypothetical protein
MPTTAEEEMDAPLLHNKISAVVVSRFDHALGEVVDSITPYVDELILVRGHEGVFERYEAVSRCKNDIVFTCDDDAIIDVAAVIAEYEPGKACCNMPLDHRKDYPDGIALVGWGCVFDKRMVTWDDAPAGAFLDYHFAFDVDAIFRRECDRVFTGLSPLKLIDVPVRHLPHAHGSDRMGREKRHGDDLKEIRRRIYAIRAAK